MKTRWDRFGDYIADEPAWIGVPTLMVLLVAFAGGMMVVGALLYAILVNLPLLPAVVLGLAMAWFGPAALLRRAWKKTGA